MRSRRLRLVLVLQAALLLVAACGTDDGTASTSAPEVSSSTSTPDAPSVSIASTDPPVVDSTETPASGAVASAVTTVAEAPDPGPASGDPIPVGFLVPAGGGGGAGGLEALDPSDVVQVLVDRANASGGLAGRPIRPVVVEFDGAAPSYEFALQAVCDQLTQDDKVVAVVGYSNIFVESFEQCLARAGVVRVAGDVLVSDSQLLGELRSFLAPSTLTIDAKLTALVEVMVADGFLDAGSRIGLFLEDCPDSARAVDTALIPALSAAGLELAARSVGSCFNGAADAAGAVASIQSDVLKFKDAGIDRVLVVSKVEPNALFAFSSAAEQQGYRPGYLISSTSGPTLLAQNLPPEQLANMRGIGWYPVVDLPVEALPQSTTNSACATAAADLGIAPSSAADWIILVADCDGLDLYRAAVSAAGTTEATAVVDAALSITDFVPAAGLGVPAQLAADHRAGATTARVLAYEGACTCFGYVDGSDVAVAG